MGERRPDAPEPAETAEPTPAPATGREIEQSVEIEASPEAVWKALTDPEELVRWFPVEADVEPGEGGSIRLSWGPGCEATAPITGWEPLSRLEWTESWPAAAGAEEPIRLVVEFRLEGRGGSTVVRLVHSGFGTGETWDDLYDGIDAGWRYMLWNLAHYLERHPGTPRGLAWVRRPTERSRDEVWRRLFADGGLLAISAGAAEGTPRPGEGEPFTLRLGGGQRGRVRMATPGAHFAGTVESLDDGLLFVEFEGGGETWHCGLWLSTYGLPRERVEALQRDLEETAGSLLV